MLAGAVIAVLGIMFWPGRGIVSRVLRGFPGRERASIEDALKHLYDCQYRGSLGSIQSLAGSLEQSSPKVAALAAHLEAMGLVHTEEAGIRLTREGQDYALRIIRIHRLWETYLADRTGFGEAEWHFQADRREHVTSAGQLQQLVRTTGNPRFDPHGDPIPTEAGEVPSRYGRPLSDCEPGDDVRIVHVEDEPEAIYAKLESAGDAGQPAGDDSRQVARANMHRGGGGRTGDAPRRSRQRVGHPRPAGCAQRSRANVFRRCVWESLARSWAYRQPAKDFNEDACWTWG